MTLDDLRTVRPELGLALYAYTPGGDVTLEVHSDGEVYSFTAATESEAIEKAFPLASARTPKADESVVSQAPPEGAVAGSRVSDHPAKPLGGAAETADVFS